MNYIGLSKYDTANGPGIRVSLFVSGCTLKCKGCFNPESWDFNAGKPFTKETLQEIFKTLDDPYISGFSILGGDPLEPQNREMVYKILSEIRKAYPHKSIWLWTGRKYEHLLDHPEDKKILDLCDCIVDGPFIEKLKCNPADHSYFGSTNQRVIKIKQA